MSTPNTPITKSGLRSIWEIGDSFFPGHARRNYGKIIDFIHLTGYIRELAHGCQRVVEVGGGDFSYARHLVKTGALGRLPFVSTDIPSQRVQDARARESKFTIEEADLLDAQARFGGEKTLFVAANVLGNIVPEDLNLFLSRVKASGSSLAFIAGGPHPSIEEAYVADKIRYDHNYFRLIREHGFQIHKYYMLFDPKVSKSATYVMGLTS
ncbi:MAG: hypothetical protein HS117_13735 [Verrucomicrobiaceae bacterium]|nr:hypothetical protein [Verrucomicrobiaceae bacterium]